MCVRILFKNLQEASTFSQDYVWGLCKKTLPRGGIFKMLPPTGPSSVFTARIRAAIPLLVSG